MFTASAWNAWILLHRLLGDCWGDRINKSKHKSNEEQFWNGESQKKQDSTMVASVFGVVPTTCRWFRIAKLTSRPSGRKLGMAPNDIYEPVWLSAFRSVSAREPDQYVEAMLYHQCYTFRHELLFKQSSDLSKLVAVRFKEDGEVTAGSSSLVHYQPIHYRCGFGLKWCKSMGVLWCIVF